MKRIKNVKDLVFNIVCAIVIIATNIIINTYVIDVTNSYRTYASQMLESLLNAIEVPLNTLYIICLLINISNARKRNGKSYAIKHIISHFALMMILFIVCACVFEILYSPILNTFVIGLIYVIIYSRDKSQENKVDLIIDSDDTEVGNANQMYGIKAPLLLLGIMLAILALAVGFALTA